MPRKMVDPQDGSVWEIPDAQVPHALAQGAVDYGSPEHMELIGGAKMPDVRPAMQEQLGPPEMEAALGMGKGGASTAAGLSRLLSKGISKVSGNRLDPYNAEQYAKDAAALESSNTMQSIGKGLEQVGEFLLPETLAVKAGKAAEGANLAGKLLRQARGARGAYEAGQVIRGTDIAVPGIRSASQLNSALGTGTRVLGRPLMTGVLNEAQGGDFGTGAALSLAGTGAGAIAGKLAPRVAEAASRVAPVSHGDAFKNALLRAAVGSGVGGIYGHREPTDLLRDALIGATLGSAPVRRLALKGASKVLGYGPAGAPLLTGTAAQFDRLPVGTYKARTRVNDVSVDTLAKSRAHVNKGD